MSIKYNSRVVTALVRIRDRVLHFFPPRILYYYEERVLHKYPMEKSDYWYSYQDIYNKVYPKDIFKGIEKVDVKGLLLPIPVGYSDFLKINYGEWNKYLSIRLRFEEFYEAKHHIEERQDYYNMHND